MDDIWDKVFEMEIVHILPNSELGGVQSFVADLSRAQEKQGQSVSIVFKDSSAEKNPIFSGLKVVNYNTFIIDFCKNKFKDTIIHTHGHVLTLIGLLSIIFRTKKLIHTIHNTPRFEAGKYRRKVHRIFYNLGSVVPVSISSKLLLEFNDLYKLNSKLSVLNGVSATRSISKSEVSFQNYPGDMNILFVGRLDYQKNLNLLLNALNVIRKLNIGFHLHVVGKNYGIYDKKLFDEMVALKMLTYYGESDDIGSFIDKADLLVQSSLFEGLPILLLEAKLKKLPVLSTNVGGCAEILGSEDILCLPELDFLVDGLQRAAERYSQYGKWSSPSKVDISIESCAAKYVEIYEQ